MQNQPTSTAAKLRSNDVIMYVVILISVLGVSLTNPLAVDNILLVADNAWNRDSYRPRANFRAIPSPMSARSYHDNGVPLRMAESKK